MFLNSNNLHLWGRNSSEFAADILKISFQNSILLISWQIYSQTKKSLISRENSSKYSKIESSILFFTEHMQHFEQATWFGNNKTDALFKIGQQSMTIEENKVVTYYTALVTYYTACSLFRLVSVRFILRSIHKLIKFLLEIFT